MSGTIREQKTVLATVCVALALATAACTSAPTATPTSSPTPTDGSQPPASPSAQTSTAEPTPLPTPYAIASAETQLQPLERFDTKFPQGLLVAFDSVWTTNEDLDTVTRIDPAGGEISTIKLGPNTGPQRITAGDDAIWAAGGGGIARIDPATNTVTATIEGSWPEIEYAFGSLWAAGDRALIQVDPRSGEIVDTIASTRQQPLPPRTSCGVSAAGGSIWLSCAATLDRIDPDAGRILATIPHAGNVVHPNGVFEVSGVLWLATGDDPFSVSSPELASANLDRIDQVANQVVPGSTVRVVQGAGTGAVMVNGTAIWVPTTFGVGPGAGMVFELDGQSGTALNAFDLSEGKGYGQNAIAFGFGSMWVASGAADQVRRFAMPPS